MGPYLWRLGTSSEQFNGFRWHLSPSLLSLQQNEMLIFHRVGIGSRWHHLQQVSHSQSKAHSALLLVFGLHRLCGLRHEMLKGPHHALFRRTSLCRPDYMLVLVAISSHILSDAHLCSPTEAREALIMSSRKRNPLILVLSYSICSCDEEYPLGYFSSLFFLH